MGRRPARAKPDVLSVARAAGVSTATVSRVMNGSPKVTEATRSAVAKALTRLGYVPEGRASRTVAIFLEDGEGLAMGAYTGLLLSELSRALAGAGFRYEVIPVSRSHEAGERAIRAAVSLTWSEAARQRLRTSHPPFTIAVNDRIAGCRWVCSDHRGQTSLAVAKLGAWGHRRIGLLVNSTENWGGRERRRGWEAGLEALGIPLDPGLCASAHAGGLEASVRALLGRKATALIVGGEDLALPAYHACARLGLKVPGDLSLITFENPWVSPWLIPPPTSLDQDAPALANAVVALLESFFSGIGSAASRSLPAILRERESIAQIIRAPT